MGPGRRGGAKVDAVVTQVFAATVECLRELGVGLGRFLDGLGLRLAPRR